MATTSSRIRLLAGAVVFFLLVVFFQLVFQWIFVSAIDARYLFQVVLTSAIMTTLFTLFTWWRARRKAASG